MKYEVDGALYLVSKAPNAFLIASVVSPELAEVTFDPERTPTTVAVASSSSTGKSAYK
jgi:hypothetical protein